MDEITNLASEVINICVKNEWRLAVTETSTGGLIAHHLTNQDGSSRAFAGSLVLYSALAKNLVLDISMDFIQNEGQISENMIRELLHQMERFPVDLNVAVTGIAGRPVEGQPRGTFIIGIDHNREITIKKFKFSGSREAIKEQATIATFKMLIELFE